MFGIDTVAAWILVQAAGLVFKPILEDLAKEATKDWAKDFCKDSLKSVFGGRDDAARAVRELNAILDTHIHDEEAVAFPRYSAAFTGAEFDELGRAAWKVVGARAVVFAGPWVLDHGTAAERAELLAEQPLLMRVLYRLALRPRYERLARPLRRDHTSVRTRTES